MFKLVNQRRYFLKKFQHGFNYNNNLNYNLNKLKILIIVICIISRLIKH